MTWIFYEWRVMSSKIYANQTGNGDVPAGTNAAGQSQVINALRTCSEAAGANPISDTFGNEKTSRKLPLITKNDHELNQYDLNTNMMLDISQAPGAEGMKGEP